MVCLTHIWSSLLSLWDIKGYRMISTSLMETAIFTLYNILPLILFESVASALCSFSLHISACLSFLTYNPVMLKLTASHHGRAFLRQDLSLFYISPPFTDPWLCCLCPLLPWVSLPAQLGAESTREFHVCFMYGKKNMNGVATQMQLCFKCMFYESCMYLLLFESI